MAIFIFHIFHIESYIFISDFFRKFFFWTIWNCFYSIVLIAPTMRIIIETRIYIFSIYYKPEFKRIDI